jgi:hypothetical protein
MQNKTKSKYSLNLYSSKTDRLEFQNKVLSTRKENFMYYITVKLIYSELFIVL